jgi:Zn-dependent oligopeptidase
MEKARGPLEYGEHTVTRFTTISSFLSSKMPSSDVRLSRGLVVVCAAWGVVNHLLGVKNSDDLRKAHETVQPEVVQLLTQIGAWVNGCPAVYP